MILKRYNLNPKETIFIDDTKLNVDGASKLGIKAIFLEDSKKLRENLISLKVKID